MSPAQHDTNHIGRKAHGRQLSGGFLSTGATAVRFPFRIWVAWPFAKLGYLDAGFTAPRYLNSAHSRPTSEEQKRTVPTITGLLRSAAVVSLSVVVGVSTAAGSYAFLTQSDSVPAGTIQAGSLGLTINGATNYALDGTPWSSLLPGDVVSRQVSVTNNGTTPAVVTASTVASPSGVIEVRVQSGICSGTITGASSTTTPTTLPGTLAGGASVTVCIQVSLTSAAVQNQSALFVMTFTAVQVLP